jgi:hypothetical protein
MLRSEAITIIKRGTGFRQTQDVAIIAALKSVQRDLEAGQTLPNWLLHFDQPIAVLAGNPLGAFPLGFLRVHEDYPMYRLNVGGAPIFIPRKQSIEATQAYVTSGESDADEVDLITPSYPSVFVQDTKTRLHFVPTPTVSFTAYLTCYMAEPTLDSEIENAWLKYAPDYVCGLAGMNIAGDLRDKGAVDRFTLMAKMGGKAFLGDIVEDELAGRPLIMGRNN